MIDIDMKQTAQNIRLQITDLRFLNSGIGNQRSKNVLGFTLIELLVSISIIAILTTLLTANFIGARQRGRDGQRKANLYQIQSALELYRSDNGNYPVALGACNGPLQSASGTKYMQKIPCDASSGNDYSYAATTASLASCDNLTSATTCSVYTIFGCLENEQDADKDASKNPSCGIGKASFTLTNP